MPQSNTVQVGQDSLRFELVPNWEQTSSDRAHPDVAGVAVNSHGEVHLFCRIACPVLVYDRSGRFLRSWGAGEFTMPRGPHGIHIDAQDFVYLVDETGHVVRKYTSDGELVYQIGTGVPSDTGHDGALGDPGSGITQAGPPFNRPTNVATHPEYGLYAADGYGNARVHHFDADTGSLLSSWGSLGRGPGEFLVPHGIWNHTDGRVFVADRENDRIQIFSSEGEWLESWTGLQRPCDLWIDAEGLVYVAEFGRFVGVGKPSGRIVHKDEPARVSILSPEGQLLLRWGGADMGAPGNFVAPHSICVDTEGSIYVAEVTGILGVRTGRVPEGTHTIQKFARI